MVSETVGQSLFAVIMEACLHSTATRKAGDLVKALGADSGISKSEVSRICADLDTEVAVFRDRSLAQMAFPYVFLDATYCKARVNHRVVRAAVGQAEQPVIRVLADAFHSPRQNIEGIMRQPVHLPQRISFEPGPVVHPPARKCRSASSSSIPSPVPASAQARRR